MSTQSAISNWLPNVPTLSILNTPTPIPTPTPASLYSDSALTSLSTSNDTRVVSNIAEHGNNTAPVSSYYDGLSWSKIHGAFGPTDDGLGIVRSWIWKHGWKVESLGERKPHWVCRACHASAPSVKPFAIGHGTKGALDHLRDRHRLSAQGTACNIRYGVNSLGTHL